LEGDPFRDKGEVVARWEIREKGEEGQA